MLRTQPRFLRIIVLGLVIVGLALPVSACGKRGNPKQPPDNPVSYPKSYPSEQ
jgi:hypothetical protein